MSDLTWPSRLDHYLNLQLNSIDWASLLLTIPVALCCTVLLALVIQSAMNKDSEMLSYLRRTYRERWRKARSNHRQDIDPASALRREVAWKQLSGDVFRKPMWPLFFSALMGAGVHVIGCFYSALLSTMVSTYSPISMQTQLGVVISLFPFFSGLNGYVAARMYKFFKGTHWGPLCILTSTGLPLFLCGCLTVINICEYI